MPTGNNQKNCPICLVKNRISPSSRQKEILARADKRFHSTVEYKEKAARQARMRRADPANKEKISEQRRVGAMVKRAKGLCSTDRRKQVVYTEKRRALKYGNTPIAELLTEAQWRDILDQYHHRCAYCGKKMERLTIDHVNPLSKGGKHSASNVVPSCGSCNSKKNAKTPEEWCGMAVVEKARGA
jgi:5-methylcytosine-specific restriction endonuclease McrA